MVTTSAGGMPPKFTPQPEFIDTNPKMAFFKEMNLLKTSGISGGWKTSKGLEFRPNSIVRRDAFIVFIYRALGSPAYTPPKKSPFIDVKTNNVFYKEITWAVSKGITTGWKTSKGAEFRPLEPVKRDAAMTFLFRATPNTKSYKPPTKSAFTDIKTNFIFFKEISWAVEKGITTGWKTNKGSEFRPFVKMSRETTAAFIMRWVKVLNTASVKPVGNATYKMNSIIAPKQTGSITFNSLVAKRFSIAPSISLLREVNKIGWEKWLNNQFAMTEAVDKKWLNTYTDKWLPMLNLPAIEAAENYKKHTGSTLTGVGQAAGASQRVASTVLRQIYSSRQVNEVWTNFWLDHFSVPYKETGVSATFNIDLWMRDKAMTSFPEILNAMLKTLKLYQFLDADQSKKGRINENLARELIELYTTGLTTGVEEDIRQLAKFLTGFSHSWDAKGNLAFFHTEHDDSTSTVKILGKTYKNSKIDYTNVYGILDQLAHNLAWDERTIKFISQKICAHFIQDNPTASMVNAVVKTYKRTGGSVKDIMMTMILHPDFTKNIGSKWRRPQEMMAAHQANLGPQQDLKAALEKHPYYAAYIPAAEYLERLGLAGHYPRNNHSPKGYDNKAATWMNASSILHTVNALNQTGSLSPKTYKTTKTFVQVLGYTEGNYKNTASKLVREVTGFAPDADTTSVIARILSDTSQPWKDRIDTAVSRAYTSPYGFLA